MPSRYDIYASGQLAGRVQRYHTWPVLHRQTTGEHSARVANIYVAVFGSPPFRMPRTEVLYWILNHDSGEQYAGDVPFGVKQAVTGLKEAINEGEHIGLNKLGVRMPTLTKMEYARAKICDLLEMWEFARIELAMGNVLATCVFEDTIHVALKLAAENGDEQIVKKWIREKTI